MEELFDLYSVETGWVKATWEDVATKRDAGFVGPKEGAEGLVPDLEALVKNYFKSIQGQLDFFARTRGYDGIISAVSYATSTDAQYALEGQYCLKLRDDTWKAANKLAADMVSGTIEPLPEDEFVGQLPCCFAEWPDDEEDDE